ncbi:MAG: hypothetical protein U0441_15285 [Polyangiaceae bacterium]
MITSLFDLDRLVREASGRLARARRALAQPAAEDEAPGNPLWPWRAVLRKDTYDELATVPEPLLAPALRAHVARLTLARVLWDDEVRIARAFREPSVELDDRVRLPRLPAGLGEEIASGGLVAPRSLLLAATLDPEEPRRRAVAAAFARAAAARLRDPVRTHADRRARAAAQLGVSLESIDLPAPAALVDGAALDLITATSGIADRFAPWDRGLRQTIAGDAIAGWPARLGPRWVLSIFGHTDLLRGIALDDVRLPIAIGGASFARALVAFGEAFGAAAAPSGAPFALHRPALDLRPARIGALLGMLVGERSFARRAMDLGPGAAIDHARKMARAHLASLRLRAAAARSRASLFPVRDDLDDRFREETSRAWGEPLPAELAGVMPRVTEQSSARFVATLLAALDRRRLIESLDEDWYRNPRSADALRAIAVEAPAAIDEATLRAGAAELARSLLEHAT